MRPISDAFRASLAAETTRLCLCWRFERVDGAIFGATDHDETIWFDGVAYEPAQALTGGVFESSSSLAPGSASASGALDASFLDAGALEAGVWNGARVDVWRVDWSDPAQRVRIWSGKLGEVTRSSDAFAAELVSLKADLERGIGRIYTRACDAEVGDARCGAILLSPAYLGAGAVVSAHGKRIVVAGLSAFAVAWFEGGRLTWTSGAMEGRSFRVSSHMRGATVTLELHPTPAIAVEPGDTFTVSAGCDKAYATCSGKFANTDNFRGFPHLPGNDALFAGPEGGSGDDGGRRR